MKVINGDALDVLRGMPEGFYDMCVTSPPYFRLRDYGAEGQIGLESSPEEYVERLVGVFHEVRRVLKDDGTLWLVIGDSYATRSGPQPPKNTRNQCGHTAKTVPPGYKAKDMIGIPWMLAFALRADGWYLRQDIIWEKPNCMPESVRDRCTKSHEYIFLLSKSPKYYFDATAISEPIAGSSTKRYIKAVKEGKLEALPQFGGKKYGEDDSTESRTKSGKTYYPARRKNKRDVWRVATSHYKGAHFAVFPENIVKPCVLAGSRQGGVVLDPFCGSGTTGKVAVKEGRDFVGIEIRPEYCEMSENRIRTED